MTVDRWEGVVDVGQPDIEDPTNEQIVEAIRRLDQERYTMVGLISEKGDLLVGGGTGRYVCSGTLADGTVITLTREVHSDSPPISVVTGGQEGAFPASFVVGFEEAMQGVKSFIADEALRPPLTWGRS
jgi:hypothetical protein